jgi:hypothetical protein
MPLVTRLIMKPAGVGTNGILDCKFLLENAHRTQRCAKHASQQLQ